MSLHKTDHLTLAYPEQTERAIQSTMPGMAHFAGSGPHGKTCIECKFFDHQRNYYAKGGKYGGRIKDARCNKYRAMMGGEGPHVPPKSAACKYFEQSASVPELYQRS